MLMLVLFAFMPAMLNGNRRLSSSLVKSILPISAVALACLLVGLVSCAIAPKAIGPRAIVDHFLDFYFHEYGSGLPDATQRATLRPLLSDDLTGALESAAAAERCASEQARGQEPPLIQGDIFSSLFEKATAVVGIDQGPGRAQVVLPTPFRMARTGCGRGIGHLDRRSDSASRRWPLADR